jgi:hypothetical protein
MDRIDWIRTAASMNPHEARLHIPIAAPVYVCYDAPKSAESMGAEVSVKITCPENNKLL